ncbi:choline ABC transporter ATP-binding protein [Pseudomonas sp. FFUP_PS_473]|jgi:glycine betaine/proline transport system ATP-binding protein|uniref:choline ABC transporter ATP-binding protein n=1 Tax=Pseudomonas TaxID=286 RepID=UPI0008113E74|nr:MULTISPECIES: choline ABC transporter ATP-binding protein [Pseudomonas]MBP9961260.1 choline ABC transporter ATP-binding protein [Pseudomonas sp.]MEE3633699.1 choline ABC transporter ATP-binding protein [Pseudomonas sp. AL 58]ATR85147.1 choline ABC transporter ATP-binding protein [Pseudomonas sp. HLS-6]PLP94920.1 choline ABC transporter ATP-binding protein [Pseudomonas sp. FFUP_PS_473]WJM97168.1 choline ABC transporter ATP-binding protein [Pseudomonas defluvii]
MSIIRFDEVDVIFSKSPREALSLLDQGFTREQILKKTGLVVGVEKASLEINKGEICVLMGLSGSGKSSLLRCINGLNTVSRGKLFVEHEGSQINIASCTPAELKMMRTKRIAMVFQKFALMPWLTVRENISFGLEMQGRPADERRRLVDEKLELVGLTQWRNKKPDELSGGMQQRVGLARALAMDADILLMDEPFSALDPLIRQGLQDELLELQRKLSKTIVFVSHDLDEALKLGSRIAIMKDGRIIQYSKPEEIVLNPADDYVRTFVAHTNPLNVLCGRSLMRTLDKCKRINGSVCIDPSVDSWLDLAEGNTIKGARQGVNGLDLQNWRPGEAVEQLGRRPTLVNAGIGMREALQIRYQTGNKLVLQEGNRVVGILGDSELYHALLGKTLG